MIFKFAQFIVNETNFSLTHDLKKIEIEPKVFNLLCFFCRNPQRAISREEMIENVWQGRVVSDAAINRAIGELRKVIELDVKSPQYIVTVSKVGYRFNTLVNQLEDAAIIENKATIQTKLSTKSNLKLLVYLATFAFTVMAVFIAVNYEPVIKSHNQLEVSATKPLTTIKGSAFKQQVFKNGQTVFLHRSPENRNVQLWLQAVNSPATKLTSDDYYYTFAIFKDEDTIFAARFDNLIARNCEIISFTISTKQAEKITDCAERAMTKLAFAHNTHKLYFNYRESVSQPYAIRSIQIDTGRIQQLTHADPKGNTRGDFLFALSPSGNKIAVFEYQPDGSAMLKVTDINSPTKFDRYQSYDGVGGISWFNEHTLLISGEDGILSYDLQSAESEYVLRGDNMTQAVYSPELSLLSYVKFDATRNIYQRSHDDNDREQTLTQSAYINFLPNYANTSDAMIYFSTDSGKLEVQLLDQKGLISTLNFPETIKHFGNLKWAVDDSFILASINSKLFKYSLDKANWQEIVTHLSSIHYVEIMTNEQVIVSSEQSGDWQLWQVDLNLKISNKITRNGGYSTSYLASENSLLLSKYSQEGLFKLDLNNFTEVKIKDQFKITDWNKWQVRGENLYSWSENTIVQLNFTTGAKSVAWTLKQNNPSYFSISADQRKLAYRVTEQEKSTIWQSTVIIKN
jgi:DNA-binding winged helix-turn-helix (wHTH) protein